ncbi:protein ANTAGONIST OF LIKE HETEROCHROMATIN PROTEIN 1-like isoform X3 [Brachypodium distachyon]|uniref:protein ANTAGONIST OF LIKE HETEROCHROMATIN PROTEIN 1-like isoform X3 n=1 Tax=Brachypodium distachyon TaxID=15368 RepID=UPI000D0CE8EE|nr:protein ANTAGONIST OF LIKE HETEROCHROMATIN PROTEIN 1-like isoform X3 [Brachypodium distachyon]|eukprot:XP_024313172.1 protein ANTAGONIST OF LIKE HETEROCHROMATIN PROTEIN 1-like isoform X3 [Brachypodium distachyon]
MAPVNKSKKGKHQIKDSDNPKTMESSKSKAKDSGKFKGAKPGCAVAAHQPDLRDPDMEWWYAFLSKQKERQADSVPSDEEEAFRPPSGLINIEGRLLSVEKQVGIAMRRLASRDSQVSVGAAFGVGQSTVSQVTWRFIESMEERARHQLVWLDQERMDDIKASFEVVSGLPNCCGAIDATHIVMTLPAVDSSEDWCDHAKNYSMFL